MLTLIYIIRLRFAPVFLDFCKDITDVLKNEEM